MRWYWLLRNARTRPGAFVGDVVDIGSVDPEQLTEGRILSTWPAATFIAAGADGRDGPPDDALQNAFMLDIHPPRLRAAVENAGLKGLQYLPILLRGSSTQEPEVFSVANVEQCLDALDHSRARFKRYPLEYDLVERRGTLQSLQIPVLTGSSISGTDVFRLCEYLPPVYVSDRFRQLVRFGRSTGYDFQEVEVV
jgi:hypothetical protein